MRKEKLKLDDAHKRELEALQRKLDENREKMQQHMAQFKYVPHFPIATLIVRSVASLGPNWRSRSK